MHFRGVLCGTILLMAAVGCGASAPGTAAPGTAASSAPAWTEPANYRFSFESSCGERALIGRFRVDVANGTVDRVQGLDEAGQRAVMLRIANLVPTLGQMAADADEARATGADEAVVERDPADGHPVAIRIDPDRNAIDDETCFTISDYTIGGPPGPEPSPSR